MSSYTVVLQGAGGVLVYEGNRFAELNDGSGADDVFVIRNVDDLQDYVSPATGREIERQISELVSANQTDVQKLEDLLAYEYSGENGPQFDEAAWERGRLLALAGYYVVRGPRCPVYDEPVRPAGGLTGYVITAGFVAMTEYHRWAVLYAPPVEGVMTTAEVAAEYGITAQAVRERLANDRSIKARKSAGTWLVERSEAKRIWGK